MKLSIITINYNNKDGLQKTIDSVICQTFEDYEWIIIDGGSTDGSKELIGQYQHYFSYWCSEPDKGIYNAMNKGVSKANGDYLLFLNSGDCLHNIEVLAQVFSEDVNADVIYGNMNFVSSNHTFTAHFPDQLSFHFFLCNSIGHPASLIRTTLLKESGYDEGFKIVSDWYKFIELFRGGRTFYHTDVIMSDFDSNGVSSNVGLAEKERNEVLIKFLGKENEIWVKESISRQKEYEVFKESDYMHIVNMGGWRHKVCRFVVRILSMTSKNVKMNSETISCT